MKEERYTVAIDFYIWAEDDVAAIKEAQAIVQKMGEENDNQPSLLSVHSTPFSSRSAISIYNKDKIL